MAKWISQSCDFCDVVNADKITDLSHTNGIRYILWNLAVIIMKKERKQKLKIQTTRNIFQKNKKQSWIYNKCISLTLALSSHEREREWERKTLNNINRTFRKKYFNSSEALFVCLPFLWLDWAISYILIKEKSAKFYFLFSPDNILISFFLFITFFF